MVQKEFKIKYSAKISQKKEGQIYLWFSRPQDDDYQKILDLKTNKKNDSKYSFKDNEIEFYSEKGKELIFEFELTADLTKDNSNSKTPEWKKNSEYITSEKFLEENDLVKDVVSKLPKDKNQALHELMNFIVSNFKYCYPVLNRGVKNLNLANLSGDCGEYSSLFVAAARKLGIAARNESGFVIYPEEKSVTEHAWASCLSENGWKDFDPQYAQLDNDIDKYFGQRSDFRITFCHGFNIPLKPALPKKINLDFWGKIGLPASSSEVQILQPLFFACENEFDFEEDIKLI
jgi:hypothetical protein